MRNEGERTRIIIDRPGNYRGFGTDEPKSGESLRERLRCESCGCVVEVIRRGDGQPMCCDLLMEYDPESKR